MLDLVSGLSSPKARLIPHVLIVSYSCLILDLKTKETLFTLDIV